MAEKKVLTLTVSKQWFDMIAAGKKTEEYLTIKSYWAKRLLLVRSELEEPFSKLDKDLSEKWDSISPEMAKYCFNSPYYKTAPYTHVLFINGYRKDSPRIEKEIESITIGKPKKAYVPTSGLILSFLSLNSSDMNYIQCDECKYRLVCNGEPLTSGSTGSCDHRVISNTPIFPKIKTPPDERYADIWNW